MKEDPILYSLIEIVIMFLFQKDYWVIPLQKKIP